MNKKTEYVITCKLTPDSDIYVLAYNEGNDGYFWTEKENIERLREQNVHPHRFIFENFHEAKTVRNIVNNYSFECGIVPLSSLYEPSYTIIHRKNPDVYFKFMILFFVSLLTKAPIKSCVECLIMIGSPAHVI